MSKTMLLLALSIILLNSKSGNHRHHSCEVFREYRVLTTIETFGIASDKCLGHFARIEEINSTQNKDARIQSLQPFVKNGYIKFSKKHKTLLKQMTEYPMGKNDDAPDGLQMAVKLALDVKIGRRVDYRSVIARALDFRRGAY